MRVTNLCLLGFIAPVVAFLPHSLKNPSQWALRNPQRSNNEVDVRSSWSQGQCSFTELNMAFQSEKPSNMFDGPMALTRERDACGVGFIANTQSGGKNKVF